MIPLILFDILHILQNCIYVYIYINIIIYIYIKNSTSTIVLVTQVSDIYTVLSVNKYTPFEKYNFKQYLNEHKNHFLNVDKTKFNITSV